MSTDFNYGNSTITTTGPVRPKDRNVPMNARYRVETYADIYSIPVPAVGELIFVMSDENNDNQQNIYVIKSLKASNLGIPNSLIDEVVPLKTFLGSDVTGGNVDLSGYAKTSDIPTKTSQLTNDSNYLTSVPSEYVTETELNTSLSNKVDKVSGYSLVSDTEIARLANVDNYDDTELMNLIPDKTSDLVNDSNFISSIPSEYVTETELNDKGYATTEYVDGEILSISIPNIPDEDLFINCEFNN